MHMQRHHCENEITLEHFERHHPQHLIVCNASRLASFSMQATKSIQRQCASLQQIHTSDSQHGNCKDVKLGEPFKLFLRCALNPTQLSNKHCFVYVLRTLCFTTLLKIASIQTDSSAQNKATSSEQL